MDIIAECIAGAGHPLNFSENVFNRNMVLKLDKKSSIIGLGRTSITTKLKEKYSIELIRRREVFHDLMTKQENMFTTMLKCDPNLD